MIDFSDYIQDRTSDFTGREWVFKSIHDWLGDPEESRFFLITGEPGSGKTAIAARLKQFSDGTETASQKLNHLKPGLISAAHFCSARDRRWINPHTFTESLALQLSALYPEFAKALAEKSGERQIRIEVTQQVGSVASGQVAGVIIKNLDVSAISPEDAFIRVVREPIEALFSSGFDKSVIILVDALDETILYSGKVGIVSLLAQAENLSERIRFILTSRRDERVEKEFLDAEGLFLSGEEYNSRNFEDIEVYVNKRLKHDEKLSSQASELPRKQVNELVTTITSKADGNFQYVGFLLDSMARGQRSLTELEGLPEGLDGLYHDSVGRLTTVAEKNWLRDFAPTLGLLSVAQEDLTFSQIQSFTEQTESTVWSALGDLQQFIEERTIGDEKRFGLFHQSFIDFLHRREMAIKKKTRRNSYYLPPGEWHSRIANYYWAKFHEGWEGCDDYGLTYLIEHALAADFDAETRAEVFDRILTDGYMQALLDHSGWHLPFLEDLQLVATVDPLRAAGLCLKIIEGNRPNSLVLQRSLRLLVELRSNSGRIGNARSSTHRAIDAVTRILAEPSPDANRQLTKLLKKAKNPRVKGVIALALGETGSRQAAPDLLNMLKTARRQGSWAAADALIALNDPAIISELVTWYQETESAADKERILYILGWMHAEEARNILPEALKSSRAVIVRPALDLMWLLQPAAGDGAYLIGQLQQILESDPKKPEKLGPWSDERVQKRLVRAVVKTGETGALGYLKRLQEHVASRGEPKDLKKRKKLMESIDGAIRDLGRGEGPER